MPITLNYNPEEVTNRLLSVLPDRNREVLSSRIGLQRGSEGQTLESVGKKYGVTRERVRQIENFALNSIRKSDQYSNEMPAFRELRDTMYRSGGLVHEEDFLDTLTKEAGNSSLKNHILLLLILCDDFSKLKEDAQFYHRWTMDQATSDHIHQSLETLHNNITAEDLVTEDEMINRLLDCVSNCAEDHKNKDVLKNWLLLSKIVGRNPLNDWGLAKSPNIGVRGIRDYAYLILRKEGRPMHFTDVAQNIAENFGKKAHTATCHNELIKDPRFVLVGRGLYGLADWGYEGGVVRDVIRELLKKNGPLDKESIIEQVLKERFVKENTVLVNLQSSEHFQKTPDGKFMIVEV